MMTIADTGNSRNTFVFRGPTEARSRWDRVEDPLTPVCLGSPRNLARMLRRGRCDLKGVRSMPKRFQMSIKAQTTSGQPGLMESSVHEVIFLISCVKFLTDR